MGGELLVGEFVDERREDELLELDHVEQPRLRELEFVPFEPAVAIWDGGDSPRRPRPSS